jgi:ubiquinone/menaquinone biosynthesis C-methylase UbiE
MIAQELDHEQLVHEQFTRQAVPFSEAPSMRDEIAIAHVLNACAPTPADCSLDVACGPGLVVLAFARAVAHATGLDATQAMLDRAMQLQRSSGIANVTWRRGDACRLPFEDATFDIVTTRFAWHHMQDPAHALAEMLRVCRPGGRLVVCDVVTSDDAAQARAFNDLERLRDPSTVLFRSEAQLLSILTDAGLHPCVTVRYRVALELEGLLRTSFPAPGDDDRVRAIIAAELVGNALDLRARRDRGRVTFSYPAVVVTALRSR